MMKTDHNPPSDSSNQHAVIDSVAEDWFILMSSGEPSEQDRIRFQHWLEESPQHRQAYNDLCELWGGIDELRDVFDTSALKSGDYAAKPETLIAKKPTIKRSFWGTAIAACLTLLVINAADISLYWMSDYRTAVGEQLRVELPDGSVAWLNTDTGIDVRYDNSRREIMLMHGEAQFDVQKETDRPFTVTAKQGQSTAIGTVYSVRQNVNEVQVTVTEGVVEVTSKKEGNTQGRVVLHQGEQTSYSKGKAPTSAKKANTRNLAWRKGFIAIQNLPLAEALQEIDRYHPGRIILMADAKKLQVVTARLAISSVDNGLDALAATQGLKVTRLTDYLVLVR